MNGRALAALVLVLVLAGCTGQATPDSSPTASGAEDLRLSMSFTSGSTVDFTVLPLDVDDGLVELRVLVTVQVDESATSAPAPVKISDLCSDSAVLADPAHHTVYLPLMESSRDDEVVPGEPYLYQAWFPAPADDTTQLDVTLHESWPRVVHVPVVRGTATPDPRARLSASDFERPSPEAIEDATVVFPLDSTPVWGVVWDYSTSAKVESLATADSGVVTLSSDILFASDSAELSQTARDAIADLVTDVPSGAAVSVDGHTDTVDDDAHNDDLSQRRAQAVADAIAAVRPDLRLTVTGHGERDLKVEEAGDDIDDDRALNRRVELTLGTTAPEPAPPPDPVTSSTARTGTSPTVLPDPKDAELLPGAKVEVPLEDGSTLRFEVEQVKVRGALTQADVIVTLVDATSTATDLYDILGSFRPALVDRDSLLRYPELRYWGAVEWPSQGDRIATNLDGSPHRFRWTFPALVDQPDTVDLVIDNQVPELTGLPVTYEDG